MVRSCITFSSNYLSRCTASYVAILGGENMNATTKCNLLTKADRINDRIDDISKMFLGFEHNKENISIKDFKDFVISVHLIVNTELNDKGVERQWKN